MTTELTYIAEKFEDIQLLDNFVPLVNRKGQAKLAFIEALPGVVDLEGEEVAKISFRFVCEGVNESRVISYTGWLKEALSEGSKLGQILKGFKIVDFETPEAVVVEEFDFESNFQNSKTKDSTVKFEELLTKLKELEGTILLAELEKDKGIWHRPEPTTFEFPLNKKGEFYKCDVASYKK